MISILTCGYKPENKKKLEGSIIHTIDTNFEFIYHDNRNNPIGICQAYNQLAKQAKGDYLCFVHEDVEFLNQGWGQLLIENFNKCDILGVAGGKYKSSTPSGWSISGYNCVSMHQYYPDKPTELLFEEEFPNEMLEEVVCLDGVLLATKKSVFEQVQFDEITFKGFHGYDYDFCLHARQKFKICVAKNISILHYSEGRNDNDWLLAQLMIHKKWKKNLPAFIHTKKDIDKSKIDFLAYKQCIYKMYKYKFFLPEILIKFFKIKHLYYGWLYFFNRNRFNQIP